MFNDQIDQKRENIFLISFQHQITIPQLEIQRT